MSIRGKFLSTLRKVTDYLLNSIAAGLITLVIFVIGFGIVGFILSERLPIALTETEIEYYTTQAEIGYLQGIYYLDDKIKFVPANDSIFDDNTFKIYSDNQSALKQKLKVTFSGNTISNKEVFYSTNFTILYTVLGVLLGIVLWVLFLIFIDDITKI